MRSNYKPFLAITGIAVLLGACGGGGGSGSNVSDGGSVTPQSFGLLRPVTSNEELGQALKRGLAVSSAVDSNGNPLSFADVAAGAPEADDGDFSTTNLQEQGVDEAGISKYDGEIMYVLDRSPGYPLEPDLAAADALIAPQPEPGSIRLFRTHPQDAVIEQVAQIDLQDGEGLVDGLFLAEPNGQKLLLGIGQNRGPVPWALFAFDYYWQAGSTKITAWDVSNVTAPSTSWTLELDGALLTSRRIENILYVVTRYAPTVEGVNPFPANEAEEDANRAILDAVPLNNLLPDVRHDGGEPQELLQADNCYLPNPDYEGLALPVAAGSLITVTAIDLTAPDSTRSICLNTFASGFYASLESLYITANGSQDSTILHKISLNNGDPQYRGSGEVSGYIGTANPSYLMSERGRDLRVFSSSWEGQFFPLPVMELDAADSETQAPEEDFGIHRLTILRESSDGTRLEKIAQLPNSDRPAHIGKPGEDIYAARFIEERAYAVTFRVIDPLYVMDLSDPTDPKLSGELELPGFSTLLQPLGPELLLGVGTHVPPESAGLTQGIKVALFNVADITSPVELQSIVIGKRGSSSPANGNYHALTLLETEGVYRAAIPIQRHATPAGSGDNIDDPWYWYDWTESGLFKFEINPGTGSLSHIGTLVTEQRSDDQRWPNYDLHTGRSVIHGDSVFFSQQAMAWAQDWGM